MGTTEIFVKPEEVDAIFEEMQKLSVSLVCDPSTLGPEYLQQITVQVRNNTNRVTFHLNEMSHRLISLRRVLAAAKAGYKIQSNELLTTNELVRKQKSIKDREAVISTLLSDDSRVIDALEQQEVELTSLIDALRLTHRELKDVASDVRNQVKIIEVEIKTKAHFGDEWDFRSKTTTQAQEFQKDTEDFLGTLEVDGDILCPSYR